MTRLIRLAIAAATLALSGGLAQAHPHIWVTARAEIVYAPDGSITGVRHSWTFDDMYSANAVQGLDTKTKGVVTREDLADLTKLNVESLKEFEYFTYAKASGNKERFNDPVDYWMDYANDVLTLNFTLPLRKPVKTRALTLEVFDPSYLVDFSFNAKEPAKLVGAPAGCKLDVAKPDANSAGAQTMLSQMFKSGDNSNFGAATASKLAVTCP